MRELICKNTEAAETEMVRSDDVDVWGDDVEAEVCRRQLPPEGGAGKGIVLRKIELYFTKSGVVYSMVPHHGRKYIYVYSVLQWSHRFRASA
jgi:hypothetical protein